MIHLGSVLRGAFQRVNTSQSSHRSGLAYYFVPVLQAGGPHNASVQPLKLICCHTGVPRSKMLQAVRAGQSYGDVLLASSQSAQARKPGGASRGALEARTALKTPKAKRRRDRSSQEPSPQVFSCFISALHRNFNAFHGWVASSSSSVRVTAAPRDLAELLIR